MVRWAPCPSVSFASPAETWCGPFFENRIYKLRTWVIFTLALTILESAMVLLVRIPLVLPQFGLSARSDLKCLMQFLENTHFSSTGFWFCSCSAEEMNLGFKFRCCVLRPCGKVGKTGGSLDSEPPSIA